MSCLLCFLEIVPFRGTIFLTARRTKTLMKQKRHIAEAIIHVLQFEDLV